MIKTQENDEKPDFGPELGPLGPNSGSQFFFPTSSVTRYHGQVSSCTISEQTSNPILRKFCDGRTDGQTDRRTRVIPQDAVPLTSSVQNTIHLIKQYLPTWYQRATIRSICDYHMIRLCSSIECLFLFKGGWSLLIKRLSIKVTLKSLLLLASMKKLSKKDE